MEETRQARQKRNEKRFVWAAALACAACVALAFWFAAPLYPAGEKADFKSISFAEAARVNLNAADIEALCTLSGVGESRARAIVVYRVEHGGFASVDEVANVPGITQEIVDSWAGLAYVSDARLY